MDVTRDRPLNCLNGQDNLQRFGIYLQFSPRKPSSSISAIEETTFLPLEMSNRPELQQPFPYLFYQQGRACRCRARATFPPGVRPIHQKGRRLPLHLQTKVEAELERLKPHGQIQRLQTGPDQFFVSPIVIATKRDGNLKLALDSKAHNGSSQKNKYQM